MQVTRRYWALVGLAGLLATSAIALAQPVLVAGAAGLGTWVLVHQWLFVRAIHRLQPNLRIRQTVDRTRVAVDEPVTGRLTVDRQAQTRVPVTVAVEAGVPLGATGATESERQCRLSPDTREATTTFTLEWPVAGQVEFDAPTVTITDAHGLFRTRFAGRVPDRQTVTIQPQQPRALHVGAGGDPTTASFGEHAGDQRTSGIEPETVRKYVPGDPLRQIDWKATARSDQLYVRTFTERVEYETAIFIDHRATMATGPPGETKLAYATQVALALLDQAEADGDPVGLYAVGDDGVTVRQPPDTTVDTYSTLRTTLHDLTPTEQNELTSQSRTPSPDPTASGTTAEAAAGRGMTPHDARRSVEALSTEASAFATRLRPFFAARQTYIQRIATQPLYTTVQAYLTTGGTNHTLSPARTVILTDETHKPEVREAVKAARQYSDHVFVFLTPSVLFEPAGLTDLETAYDRYTDFEAFRQNLAGLEQVSAFEVAPGDRLATLKTAAPTTVPQGD